MIDKKKLIELDLFCLIIFILNEKTDLNVVVATSVSRCCC